jgi:hypothetical protein
MPLGPWFRVRGYFCSLTPTRGNGVFTKKIFVYLLNGTCLDNLCLGYVSGDGLFTTPRRKLVENAAHRARSIAGQQKGRLWMETI